jgi:RNA methyltransferase, TrmH family
VPVRLAAVGATLMATGDDMVDRGVPRSGSRPITGAGADDLVGPRHRAVQRLRRLARRRDARTDEAAYVVDGPTLLDEALRAGVAVDEVVAEPGVADELLDRARESGAVVHRARPGTVARASDTVQPQPVAAIARFAPVASGRRASDMVDAALQRAIDRPLVIVMVGVNDPGNAGTVLRSAEATGAALVAFCDGSVDPYNPKCVRGSAGALFRLPTVREAEAADVLAALRRGGVRCLGAVARGGTSYDQVDLASIGTALVLGSESHGIPDELAGHLDGMVSIPMAGQVESLNLSMAATILCFEAQRQRRRWGSEPAGGNPLDATTDADTGCNPR